MIRLAIPEFQSRVSPVFDLCTRVLIVDIDHHREVARNTIFLEGFSLHERLNILLKSHASTVICAGISDLFHTMLEKAGVRMVTGIAGEIDQIVTAYIGGDLDHPRFQMPGHKETHPGSRPDGE